MKSSSCTDRFLHGGGPDEELAISKQSSVDETVEDRVRGTLYS
jgi:hypothetical protein